MGVACGCASRNDGEVAGDEPLLQVSDEPEVGAEEEGEAEDGQVTPPKEEYECPWKLPPGKRLTVMTFGMTGAGKSSLCNLIAGSSVFAAGDDTASVTNLDSVMKWEAEDSSIMLLDTIGLGDTEIDQEKVCASIRDVALSAIDGVDILLYVMRNTRITDDAIMRLIYVTEYLWGQECLLNLYIVVTCASKYAASREEADTWVKRQVDISWRFKHIYSIVGNNPNRFIFVDNPDPDCGEPGTEDRRNTSLENIMKMCVLHPREIVPPFTHEMMKRAQELTEKERQDLQEKELEVQRIQQELDTKKPKPKAKGKAKGKKKVSAKQQPKRSSSKELKEDAKRNSPGRDALSIDPHHPANRSTDHLEKVLSKAKKDRQEAKKAMEAKVALIKKDQQFQQQAMRQVDMATFKFSNKLPMITQDDAKNPDAGSKEKAGRRIMGMLSKRFTGSKGGGGSSAPAENTENVNSGPEEDLEERLDALLKYIKMSMGTSSPADTFKKLGGWDGAGAITPMVFNGFLKSAKSDIKPHHIGGLWRRGDSNCDGQIDLQEFRTLFGEASKF